MDKDLAVSGNTVYYATADGAVTAWDITTQKTVWTSAPARATGRAVTGAPAVARDWLLVPFDKAELYALDLATGETRWSFREEVLAPGNFADLSLGGEWVAAPNANGYLYLFHVAGGTAPSVAESQRSGPAGDNRELLKSAKKAFLEGRYDDAAAHYRQLIELEPDNAKAHYNLAVALEYVGGERYAAPIVLHEAAEHYERALEIDPEFLPACINLGILYSKLQENGRAAEVLRKALAVRDDKNVRYNLAVILEKLKRFDEAREQWQAYLAMEDDPDARRGILDHLEQLPKDK